MVHLPIEGPVNAVEIEEAVSELAALPFNGGEFPFAFLRAFGRKDVELQRLRRANASDVPGGVLRRDSLHMAVCAPGATGAALATLRDSPKTGANRVKFIIATDGVDMEAEETGTGEVCAFPLPELGRHFGFFLPLAGISAVKAIKDNPIDVKAVGRLNKLYIELLRENPDWAEEAQAAGAEPADVTPGVLLLRRGHGHLPRRYLFTDTVKLLE